ncbi:MAG: hypothetical protein JSS97_00360 [Actinobacteria bacterium]|nr:hypothetical protein [Actinomycetota bacterium]
MAQGELADAERPRIGTVITLPGAALAELLAEPFDLVWIDLEHGALGPRDAQDLMIGIQAAGTQALVRMPADAYHSMTAMLDAGADGVVLADVRDAAVASAAVERIKHPPDGIRGWGPRRLTSRGRRSLGNLPALSIGVQIESAEGLRNAAAIAAVPGVDAMIVGTADLSFSLGAPLDTRTSEMSSALATVRAAARGAGVAYGVAGAVDRLPPEALAEVDVLVHSTDARLCADAVDTTVTRLRAACEREEMS